jgi:hypothetical protein
MLANATTIAATTNNTALGVFVVIFVVRTFLEELLYSFLSLLLKMHHLSAKHECYG